MPCFKCANGKWKFGRTGACTHATKSACDAANKPKKRQRKVYGKTQIEDAMYKRLREDDECGDC